MSMTGGRGRLGPRRGLTPRQVDLLLGWAVAVTVVSGLASWAIGTGWARVATAVHAVAGLSLVVLAPAKASGSARTGIRRGRRSSVPLSLALAALTTATVALGVLHATGLWYGVGYWSALWTHVLLAVAVVVLVVWHVRSRPSRARRVELDRRALLSGAAAVAVSAAVYAGQEVVTRVLPLAGGRRRFTGSHEQASFDPAGMPTVQWLDDTAPRTPADDWRLVVGGRPVSMDELRARAVPVVADLDCTGGWWSRQRWDAVPLVDLVDLDGAPSISVTSATGYRRRFPAGDIAHLHLAVGYGGEPLRRGHGAPARLVAPGRRGPWWVKWVTSIEPDDRPWWLQLPFPPT